MEIGGFILGALGLIGLVIGLVVFVVLISFFSLWLQARLSGAPVSFLELLAMKLRRVPIGLIVTNRITAVKAGLPISTSDLEAHYLAGGDVTLAREHIDAIRPDDKPGIKQGDPI